MNSMCTVASASSRSNLRNIINLKVRKAGSGPRETGITTLTIPPSSQHRGNYNINPHSCTQQGRDCHRCAHPSHHPAGRRLSPLCTSFHQPGKILSPLGTSPYTQGGDCHRCAHPSFLTTGRRLSPLYTLFSYPGRYTPLYTHPSYPGRYPTCTHTSHTRVVYPTVHTPLIPGWYIACYTPLIPGWYI